MRQVRAGLPARGHSQQGLRAQRSDRRPLDFQIARRAAAGMERIEIHAAGRGRGLHRLRRFASMSARRATNPKRG